MRWFGRIVVGLVWPLASAALVACSPAHAPQDSTETGNPPAIDASRVGLGTRGSDVLVSGSKGAVSPGGVALRVRNLASGARASGHAARDGSFDLKAPGGSADVYSLQAGSGSATTKPVFVLPSGAFRGQGKDGALSCAQQDQFAGQQLSLIDHLDLAKCQQDSDCVTASTLTVCHDACSDEVVSKSGATLIDALVSSIDQGLCSGFVDAGCEPTKLVCPAGPAPGRLRCAQGHCASERIDAGAGTAGASDAGTDAGDAGALACADRVSMSVAMLDQAIQNADKNCTQDADCELAHEATACGTGCSYLGVSLQGQAAVDAVVTTLDNGLCKNFQADGCTPPLRKCTSPPKPFCTQNQCAGMLPP